MRRSKRRPPLRRAPLLAAALLLVAASAVIVAAASANTTSKSGETIKVGLITKDVTNPFFVKMKQGATAEARKRGAELLYAAGKSSSDNAGQIAAIENMVTAGVKGILITVADGKAENPAIAASSETVRSRSRRAIPRLTWIRVRQAHRTTPASHGSAGRPSSLPSRAERSTRIPAVAATVRS